jgi:hypothetical protein
MDSGQYKGQRNRLDRVRAVSALSDGGAVSPEDDPQWGGKQLTNPAQFARLCDCNLKGSRAKLRNSRRCGRWLNPTTNESEVGIFRALLVRHRSAGFVYDNRVAVYGHADVIIYLLH